MPIEIRELQIRTVVEPSNRPVSPAATQPDTTSGKDDLIARCVEQVMQILNDKKER